MCRPVPPARPSRRLPAGSPTVVIVAAIAGMAVAALLCGGCSAGRDVPANYPDGQLPATEVARQEQAAAEQAAMQTNRLIGTVWELIVIDMPDRDTVFIDVPDDYLLQFKNDKDMAVKADCNSCEGAYSSTGRALVVRVDCETVGCRPGSHGELYMDLLNSASSFSLAKNDTELYVNFGAEQGVLTFRGH
jgi:hypothetical protein